ncbi:MAG: hypothetical protein U0T69_06400 [Chitinophagales bacterium]
MKKYLLLVIISLSVSISFAQTKADLASAIKRLYTKISYMDQPEFELQTYAELAYLKRIYKLDSFNLKNGRYIASLNDHYYKRFYLYSKLLNENAIVTEDCLHDEANENLHPARKLIFYTLYPNSIKVPDSIIYKIEEYATIDEFFGPYYALNTIYFLKKYNYDNLTAAQKTKLKSVENSLSDLLYTKYISGTDVKTWSFYKFLSLKVLKMNKNPLADNVNISLLVGYVNSDKELSLSDIDSKDIDLLKRVGGKTVFEYILNSTMWIFLLELNKI